MILLTKEEKKSYEREICRCICKNRFTTNNKKVRDQIGKYREAPHSK